MTATTEAPAPDAAGTAAPWMTVRGVGKSYAGVRALQSADLDLRLNTVYGVIGPNGAGKSTFVKILAGVLRSDGGEILIDGEPADIARPSAAVGYRLVMMPQELTIVPDFSVAENITLGAEPTRRGLRSGREVDALAERALAAVGLDLSPRALAGTLQPVDKRLLMLATAVNRRARLLILDEPTAGLPRAEAAQVTRTVTRLRDQGLTIVYVSHHLSEVAELSDEVICVREGTITSRLGQGEITRDKLIATIIGGLSSEGAAAAGLSAAASEMATGMAADPVAQPTESMAGPPAGARIELNHVTGARLRDVSLTAVQGEVTGVTGLLGSGVSEVVGILSGAVSPVAGEIRLDGAPIVCNSPADALRHSIGTLSGDRARSAVATMSVRDNVSITALRQWFGRVGIISRRTERGRTNACLEALSVAGSPERPISALSGGNQQRALVARLMAADLGTMIFDEPTIGVDIGSRAQLWREVRALAENRIVVLASSEPEELIALCDRVVCLHDGAVAAVLVGEEITERALAGAIS